MLRSVLFVLTFLVLGAFSNGLALGDSSAEESSPVFSFFSRFLSNAAIDKNVGNLLPPFSYNSNAPNRYKADVGRLSSAKLSAAAHALVVSLLSARQRMGFATLAIVALTSTIRSVSCIGANWGSQSSHRLPPESVVRMLRENGIQKVKLFDADYDTLRALGNSGIEVMVGIPNDMLYSLSHSTKAAEKWVSENVTHHLTSNNVVIRYVAVGNEPFLQTYNRSFLQTTYPALMNIQNALTKAGHGNQVKVTCPLNADVYSSSTGVPSGGDFRQDIHDFILPIVKLLSDAGAPFTVNIYPFISLYTDANFPVEYAFFDGKGTPLNDGGTTYTNMFDANHDTLVWALQRNGFQNLPIVIGEIGWPTDGDRNANAQYAQRFNQGFMQHIAGGKGTPMRPGPIDAYLFSLIDEDDKSIQPGNFERHWGIFWYDGQPKYDLNLGTTNSGGLAPVRNVEYLAKQWCIFKPGARLEDAQVAPSVSYACALGDCTSLGYETSCGGLDARGNMSYAFNSYYQKNNQLDVACKFSGLGTTTREDPSLGTCRFGVMIKLYYGGARAVERGVGWGLGLAVAVGLVLLGGS